MNIKTIGFFAIFGVLVMAPCAYAEDDFDDTLDVEYEEDYEIFDDVEDLIEEESFEAVEIVNVEPQDEEVEATDVSVPRMVADRLSCDEINTRVTELRADVKSYPELKPDLEYMLARQRNQCAPRATRRPVHNYKNVNPVMNVEVPEIEISTEPPVPEKTSEEIAAEEAAAEVERQAQIKENRSKGLCDDGTKTNQYGCCADEVFKQVEHLNFACCPKDGDGECREPRKK